MDENTPSVADLLEKNAEWLQSLGCQGYNYRLEDDGSGKAEIFVPPDISEKTKHQIRDRLQPFPVEFEEMSGEIRLQ